VIDTDGKNGGEEDSKGSELVDAACVPACLIPLQQLIDIPLQRFILKGVEEREKKKIRNDSVIGWFKCVFFSICVR
jgi:hypothetical protein